MTFESRHNSRICRPGATTRATTYRSERPALSDRRRATSPRLWSRPRLAWCPRTRAAEDRVTDLPRSSPPQSRLAKPSPPAEPSFDTSHPLIVFDGVCVLRSGLVRMGV